MKYSEFVQYIVDNNPEIYKKDVKRIVDFVFGAMKLALMRGNSISMYGVCVIYPYFVKRTGKKLVRPHDREEISLDDKVRLRLRPSRRFVKRLTERLLGEYKKF